MLWKLKAQNPALGGGRKPVAMPIPADSLSQAIEKAAAWIDPDFHGFSLVKVARAREDPRTEDQNPHRSG